MEIGTSDGQLLPGPNECRDDVSRGERLLDQRNAGGASGAEDAQFHRSPPIAIASRVGFDAWRWRAAFLESPQTFMRLEPKGSFVPVRPARAMSGSNSRLLEQRGALAWASVPE
jgi:hypothetical protein